MTRRKFWLTAGAISVMSLWLRAGFPVYAPGASSHDDMLFIKLAGYLGSGHWLGPYNELTLAKGMFYPLFVLVAFVSAIPLKIAEQMVYLGASALIARVVAGRSGSERLSLFLFAALAFNPVLWSAPLARVMREGIYLSLCLATVTLVLAISFPHPDGVRRGSSWKLAIALGLVGAALWLTREEGFWLVPASAVPLAIMIFQVGRLRPIVSRLKPLGVSLTVFTAVLVLVAATNATFYGVFRLTDFQSGNFIEAYGAISRISPATWRRYVVFPKDSRLHAYDVSPAARELRPYLDGEGGRNWRDVGCSQTKTTDCPEILSGWFMWALRDATTWAGHYIKAPEADRFYKRLANEINDACDTGKLSCLPRRVTMLPPFRWHYLTDAIGPAGAAAELLFHLSEGRIGAPPSEGEDAILRIFSNIVGGIAPKTAGPNTVIRGWAGSAFAIPKLYVAGGGTQGSRSTVELLDPAYLAPPFRELKAVQFVVTTDCPVGQCSLVVTDGADEARIPLNALASQTMVSGHVQVSTDSSGRGHLRDTAPDPKLRRQAIQVRIAAVIARIYWFATPVLSVLATLGIGLCLWLRRRHAVSWPLLALCFTSLVAVSSRVALLAYMDVSSIPGVSLLYVSPASPFVIVFAVIGSYLGFSAIRRHPG